MFKKLIPLTALLFVAACAPSYEGKTHCSCSCCKEACHCTQQAGHCQCHTGQNKYPHEKESKDGIRRLQGKQCDSCPKSMQAH